MNGGDILFDALNGVSDRYVLEAGDLLRIGEKKPNGRGKAKLWKTALLAAALALLLAAAAHVHHAAVPSYVFVPRSPFGTTITRFVPSMEYV